MITKQELEKIDSNCIKYCNREEKLSFFDKKHKKRKYCVSNLNKNEILAFKVDDGFIKSKNIKKCDFCMILENDICYLIELKGQNIDSAAEQIYVTIDSIKDKYKINRVLCRMVVSHINTHKINGPHYIELRKYLRKINSYFYNKKFSILHASQILEESINYENGVPIFTTNKK